MYRDLTKGSITKNLILFALPMIAGNLLQQLYNIADTLIVGRVLGKNALAAVGSAYTLMTFVTSIFLGLSMGAGALFSVYYGKRDKDSFKSATVHGFFLILLSTVILNVGCFAFADEIISFLQIPSEISPLAKDYLIIIFCGIVATSLYNFFTCLLRAVGNSTVPLCFLAVSAVLNIVLDLLFVLKFGLGIKGAAVATVISQYVSGVGISLYYVFKCKRFLPQSKHFKFDFAMLKEIFNLSFMTCAQQSAMNFGILLVQRLVDSFGAVTMAAFAAAVKIDTFAYLPVQDFGNAYSTFVAQNYGAEKSNRLRDGMKKATLITSLFSVAVSALVFAFAKPLMMIFVKKSEVEVLASGVRYLRIEGAFYIGIGILFLLYGFYRAVKKPGMSLALTIISLGLRVALAYAFAPIFGEVGIWIAIPIGWFLADVTGLGYYFAKREKLLNEHI